MSIFRSEILDLYGLTISKDSAWIIMNELGKMDTLHFIDLNTNEQIFSRTFINFIKRCEDAERLILYIEELCKSFKVKIINYNSFEVFLFDYESRLESRKKDKSTFVDDIIQDLNDKETSLKDHLLKYDALKKGVEDFILKKAILKNFLKFQDISKEVKNNSQEYLLEQKETKIDFITGVIKRNESERFKRLLFRATRGNTLIYFNEATDLDVEEKESLEDKILFTIMYPSGDYILQKLKKIIEAFSVAQFIESASKWEDFNELDVKYKDQKNVLASTKEQIIKILEKSSLVENNMNASFLSFEKCLILKEKALYFVCNMLKVDGGFLKGFCWCPQSDTDKLKDNIAKIENTSGYTSIQLTKVEYHSIIPPTKIQTNDFTQSFQDIVSTYGVPSYEEINPAFFTIITFPFLFGIMFGDICHGLVLFFISLFLIVKKDSIIKGKSILSGLVSARYLLLLCGFFATYVGLIYNDFASLSFRMFSSSSSYSLNLVQNFTTYDINVTRSDHNFPFGFDPIWSVSSNKLLMENSFKMKISVIFGVCHMSLGIIIKFLNKIHFKSITDIIFECIPQFIFLISLFGFMDLLIIVKWGINWDPIMRDSQGTPPYIITYMTDMFMKFGHTKDDGYPIIPFGNYNGETLLNQILIILAVACIPLMLFFKPIILLINNSFDHKKEHEEVEDLDSHKLNVSSSYSELLIFVNNNKNKKEIHFQFSEAFVHQLIETIEFCLGAISNTASYLRLWALSLAHCQLAEVFYGYSLGLVFQAPLVSDPFQEDNRYYYTYSLIVFYIGLAGVTFCILLCIDILECFLHTLRLHWVEFQNKFYQADGYSFKPYSFKEAIFHF